MVLPWYHRSHPLNIKHHSGILPFNIMEGLSFSSTSLLLCLASFTTYTEAYWRQNHQGYQPGYWNRPNNSYYNNGYNHGWNGGWNGYGSNQREEDRVGSEAWLKIHANPLIPKFPTNYPFPPRCVPADNPGFKFPDQPTIYYKSQVRVKAQYSNTTEKCEDPRYSEYFYVLKSVITLVADDKEGDYVFDNRPKNTGNGNEGSSTTINNIGNNSINGANIKIGNFGWSSSSNGSVFTSGPGVSINSGGIVNGVFKGPTASTRKYYTVRGEAFEYKPRTFYVYLRGPPPGKTDDTALVEQDKKLYGGRYND